MLKLHYAKKKKLILMQPPSGGCVLKPSNEVARIDCNWAATFGWLCVETAYLKWEDKCISAATFGWLCVETNKKTKSNEREVAATFGWLCVETDEERKQSESVAQPPSGGCVLKLKRCYCLH